MRVYLGGHFDVCMTHEDPCDREWYTCVLQVGTVGMPIAIRLEVIREQGANHLRADDVPAKIDEDVPQQLLVSAFRKYAK